jgi:hypothetical protein
MTNWWWTIFIYSKNDSRNRVKLSSSSFLLLELWLDSACSQSFDIKTVKNMFVYQTILIGPSLWLDSTTQIIAGARAFTALDAHDWLGAKSNDNVVRNVIRKEPKAHRRHIQMKVRWLLPNVKIDEIQSLLVRICDFNWNLRLQTNPNPVNIQSSTIFCHLFVRCHLWPLPWLQTERFCHLYSTDSLSKTIRHPLPAIVSITESISGSKTYSGNESRGLNSSNWCCPNLREVTAGDYGAECRRTSNTAAVVLFCWKSSLTIESTARFIWHRQYLLDLWLSRWPSHLASLMCRFPQQRLHSYSEAWSCRRNTQIGRCYGDFQFSYMRHRRCCCMKYIDTYVIPSHINPLQPYIKMLPLANWIMYTGRHRTTKQERKMLTLLWCVVNIFRRL